MAYVSSISDWSSGVCSAELVEKCVCVERTDRRRFRRHRPPVGAELVGEGLRHAGIDALPQLRLRHGDDDAAVGGDLEERVEQGFALGNAQVGWVDSRP